MICVGVGLVWLVVLCLLVLGYCVVVFSLLACLLVCLFLG